MNVVFISDICLIWIDIYISKIIECFVIGIVEVIGVIWIIVVFVIWMIFVVFFVC